MRYIAVLILLVCAQCKRSGSTSIRDAAEVDSIIAYLKTTVNPLFHKLQTERAVEILDSVRPIVMEQNNSRLTSTWMRFKSVAYSLSQDIDSAEAYANQALTLALENDTTRKEILAAQIQKSEIFKKKKLYDSAVHYALSGYYLAKEIDTAGIAAICLRLADIYNLLGDHVTTEKYLFEGWEKCTRPELRPVLANRISNYYESIDKIDSAIFFLRKMEKDTLIRTAHFDAVIKENLSSLLNHQKKYKEALPYLLEATAINRQIGRIDGYSYFNLASTYAGLKNYPRAQAYLDSAMVLAAQDDDVSLIRRVWFSRGQNHASVGKSKLAFSSLDSAYSYFPVELDSSLAIKGRELEAQYNDRYKESQIQALAIKAKMTEQQRRQQALIYLFITIILLLSGVIGILFWKKKELHTRVRAEILRQQLLRSQMNPHFIFNFLGVLQSLIRSEARDRAIEYLQKFARLVRLSLENSKKEFVSLKDELTALEDYLSLQQLLCEDKFSYSINNFCKPEEILLPPMILQPFVENSILKGFTHQKTKGEINVIIEKKDDMLHCLIEDNGIGLRNSVTERTKRSSTSITKDRLAILSRITRSKASLTITDKSLSHDEHGVRVELYMPFIKKENRHMQYS